VNGIPGPPRSVDRRRRTRHINHAAESTAAGIPVGDFSDSDWLPVFAFE
jgi:hypothetical protein